MAFFEELMEKYYKITFPENVKEIAKIGGREAYYLANDKSAFVSAKTKHDRNVIELDMKSAYPTLCKIIYKDNPPVPEFVEKIFLIQDKLARNAFITTTLAHNPDTADEIKRLNQMCKLTIFGFMFDNIATGDDVEILEFKKDGIVAVVNDETKQLLEYAINGQVLEQEFTSFIISNDIKFHIETYNIYARSNRTSIFVTDDKIKLKGQHTKIPPYLHKCLDDVARGNELSTDIYKYYNKTYFEILRYNNLSNELHDKYITFENKVLNSEGQYELLTHRTVVDPKLYIKTFLYPTILAHKIGDLS
jgi:hypothetical protein